MSSLHGERVRLRALRLDDRETLRGFVNDPEVMRHSNAFAPVHEPMQQRWMDAALNSTSAIWFGICETSDSAEKLVGTCCLIDLDPITQSAELRVRIGTKEAWGRGLGGEACQLLIRYGFLHRNLQRIWLRVHASNERAIRLYCKQGFQEEGLLRRAAFIDGAWLDVKIMALLREQWPGA